MHQGKYKSERGGGVRVEEWGICVGLLALCKFCFFWISRKKEP